MAYPTIILACCIFLIIACKKDTVKSVIPIGSEVEYYITASNCIDTVRYAEDNEIVTIPEGSGIVAFGSIFKITKETDSLVLEAGLGYCVPRPDSTVSGYIRLNGNTVRQGSGKKLKLKYP